MNKNRNLFVFVMVCCSVFGASRIVAMEEEVEDLFRARQALDRELANPKSDLNTVLKQRFFVCESAAQE